MTAPNYNIVYPPSDGIDTLPTLVTTNIAAYKDSTGTAQNLTIGASSNLVAQAVVNVSVQHGIGHDFDLSTSDGTVVNKYMSVGYSNSRVVMSDLNQSGMSLTSTDTFIGHAHFVESANQLTLSMPSLSSGLQVAPAVAMQSTLAVALDTSLNQNLFVTGDTGMGGRLVTYGGIFTPELALYKTSTNSGASQVGYTMQINANDQLELIKYTFFGSSTTAVAKRVAVFGNSALHSTDTNDNAYTASLITTSSGTQPGSGGTPGFSSAASAFTVGTGTMYTMNAMAVGTSNVNSNIALLVKGSVVATTNISSPAFLTTSDERLKDLYAPLSGPDALDGIMGLSPLTYSWKSDAEHVPHVGFTAQNIGAQLPLAVQTTFAGSLNDALHIDNTAVLAYLVAAVKELGNRSMNVV